MNLAEEIDCDDHSTALKSFLFASRKEKGGAGPSSLGEDEKSFANMILPQGQTQTIHIST